MGSLGLILRFLWAMALVLGLAYVAARMLKRIGFGRVSPSRYLNQIDYLPLGPKRGVALVQIVDRTVALGVTDQSISLLMEIDQAVMAHRALETETVPPDTLSAFRDEVIKRLRRDGR